MYINLKYIVFIFVFFYVEFSFASFTHLKEGDQCDTKKTHKTCQNIKNCPLSGESVKKGFAPDICGIGKHKEEKLVCCDKTFKKSYINKKYELEKEEDYLAKRKIIKRAVAKKPGEISKQKCQEYAKTVISVEESPILLPGASKIEVDNCAIRETPLIVGGERANPKEFPHMALIGHSDTSGIIFWQCGGSLISERWVISAAHCTATKRGLANWATLGDLKILSNDDEDSSRPVTLKIIERKNYPQYEASRGYHDIALYKLEKDVEFNAYVRPICLSTANTPYSGKAIATGWGNTQFRGFSSQDMLRVVLNLHNMNECNNLFKTKADKKILAKVPEGITANNMVCAWEQGKDTCQGDSGGPLQRRLNDTYCMYEILGITSFGDKCATDLPGIYTRVSHYVPWIESIVWA